MPFNVSDFWELAATARDRGDEAIVITAAVYEDLRACGNIPARPAMNIGLGVISPAHPALTLWPDPPTGDELLVGLPLIVV